MANEWKHERAVESIKKRIADVKEVTIKDYVRDMSLENIQTSEGYRVDAVHLYADILNMDDILGTTETEGVTTHRRTLRFLNQHYRAVSRILNETSAKRIDFHNQRLHALVAKPYNTEEGAEASRIHKAIAIAQLVIDVLEETGDADANIPNAIVRVGIDSGKSLAVNNGRSGYREPLFLGEPANHAAKFAAGEVKGIFLTDRARQVIGLAAVTSARDTALTIEEVEASQGKTRLSVTKDSIVKEWKNDLEKHPIGSFEFTRQTPPLRDMDIASLTPGNSKRQDATSIYADIDGFTAYVSAHIDTNPEDLVRTLHVLRAELERVLTRDFGGRRIRFIGDCVHGLLCEGTAYTTDEEKTISESVLCAGGLRSSFDEALVQLKAAKVETGSLGLAIGFEFGPMTATRLGIHGDRIRCSVSRGVLEAENEQLKCKGDETGLGQKAYDKGSDAVRKCFGAKRKKAKLDYNEAVEALSERGDQTAKAVRSGVIQVAASIGAPIYPTSTVRPYAKP